MPNKKIDLTTINDSDINFLLNQAKKVNEESIVNWMFIKNLPTWFIFNQTDKK